MDWITFGQLHDRLRRAQLPGYQLTFEEGANEFHLVVYLDNGREAHSRDHSSSVLLEWFDAILSGVGA